ncbi:MAG: retention module-containing protein, partial [Burkholderiales bacterium]|nr:retention module-containing protein [Burkholderiales bacterium]
MAQIAKVVAITGNVIAVGLDGQARILKIGDVIERSETLRTFAGARVELQMTDGQVLAIAPEQSVRVEDSLLQTDATPTAQEAAVQAATPAAVLQALQLGADPFAALEAPAAGLTAGGDAGGGSSFVRLLRIVEGVEPLAYEYTLGPPPTIENVPLSAEPVGADLITLRYIQLDDSGQPLRQNGGLVFLDGHDVVEGTRVGLYATVNTPPSGTDLVINLSNGQSITIPVGGGSGLVEVSVRPDDPYIQGREVIDIGVTGANGGSYDQLDVDQSKAITVVDDQDLTRVGIIGPDSVREGDITAPYTVTLEHPGQTPVVVTFQYSGVAQNGVDFTGVASITIPAGQSSQTFTIQTLDDKLVEGSELYNIRIESISGGNFERFEVNPTASAVDTTIIDDDTIPLIEDAQSRVSEEGLPAGIPDGLGSNPGNDLTDSATDSSGALSITRNGTAPLTVELINPGSSVLGATNLTWAYGTSQAVLIGSDAGGEVIRVTLNGGTTALGASGSSVPYSVVLSQPVSHLLQGQGTAGEDTASLSLTVRISDGVNPADESTITVTVEDDSPVITSVAAADLLTVDESNLAANATANFADNFSSAISYGADGPGTTGYSLALTGANVNAGLYALGVGGA